MEQQQHVGCMFCKLIGHSISECMDPIIEDTWKYLISNTDLQRNNDLILGNTADNDSANARRLLEDYDNKLISALAVQKVGMRMRDSRGNQITRLSNRIREEVQYFRALSGIQRNEYLEWLYPGEDISDDDDASSWFSDDDEIPEWDATIFDDNIFDDGGPTGPTIPLEKEGTWVTVEPIILCLETCEELAMATECVICYEEKTVFDMDTFQCQHQYCHTCVMKMMDQPKPPNCPFCRAPVQTIEVKDVDNYNDIQTAGLYLF